MKTIKELSDRQIKLAWISSKSLYEICKKLEIHDNTYNRKYLRVWGVKEGLKIPVFTRFTKTDYIKNPKLCKKCKKPIPWNQRENNFCSHSCATSYTNIKRGAITSGKYVKNATSKCLNCGKEIFARNKYCSIICQKTNYTCEIPGCGCNFINPYTGLSILQIHHIDGDATNNKEQNLQVLCPNHHAMTEHFGSRNKNSTRKYRYKK